MAHDARDRHMMTHDVTRVFLDVMQRFPQRCVTSKKQLRGRLHMTSFVKKKTREKDVVGIVKLT